jgi:hypothetical protein
MHSISAADFIILKVDFEIRLHSILILHLKGF